MVIGAAPGIRKHCLRATVDFGVPRLADDVIVHPTEGNNMGVIKAALTARYQWPEADETILWIFAQEFLLAQKSRRTMSVRIHCASSGDQ
jgi:hypothetical protein